MKNTGNKELLRSTMLNLGFREITAGTAMLRRAVEYWRPGMMWTKELVPHIAHEFGTTPRAAERAMRYAIATAWNRGDPNTAMECFGHTIGAAGRPTIGEFVSQMAHYCGYAD